MMNSPQFILCPDDNHDWHQIREGVRWCRLCKTLQYDVVGNLIYFPVGLPSSRLPARRNAPGKIFCLPHCRL
jgi:hypothetical protein